MKVLIVSGIFPPDVGGPATYVPQMAKALAARGHQITVVTLSNRLDHDDSRYPFQVVRILRLMAKPLRWVRTIASVVRTGRPADVLFINGLIMESVLANLVLRKPMVLKVVGDLAWERSITHGWVEDNFEVFQEKRYSLKVNALKALRAWWTRRAHKVLVPSRYLAQWVAGWGVPQERLVVIYNAVEPVKAAQPCQVPLQTPLKVVTVGRLVPWKHVDKILDAIANLEGVGLVVIGEGAERERLEKLVQELGTSDRIFFAGQCDREKTLGLMAACDLFVLNSSYEGLPHVVLEAMTLGLPVVATSVGGTPEVVQDGQNGRLIPPFDGKALEGCLSELLSSASERRRLAAGARLTAEQFAYERMVEETDALLESVARRVAR